MNDRRSDVLVAEWEGELPSWIGGTFVSKKTANREYQPVGLAFVAALVKAAVINEERG